MFNSDCCKSKANLLEKCSTIWVPKPVSACFGPRHWGLLWPQKFTGVSVCLEQVLEAKMLGFPGVQEPLHQTVVACLVDCNILPLIPGSNNHMVMELNHFGVSVKKLGTHNGYHKVAKLLASDIDLSFGIEESSSGSSAHAYRLPDSTCPATLWTYMVPLVRGLSCWLSCWKIGWKCGFTKQVLRKLN